MGHKEWTIIRRAQGSKASLFPDWQRQDVWDHLTLWGSETHDYPLGEKGNVCVKKEIDDFFLKSLFCLLDLWDFLIKYVRVNVTHLKVNFARKLMEQPF